MYSFSISLHFDVYLDKTLQKEIIEDYSWWFALVKKLSTKVDNFEIRCWKKKEEAIAIGKLFGSQIKNIESDEVVFVGQITNSFLEHICTDAFGENGGLKWFTLNLYKGEKLIFHSGHYGTQSVIYAETEDEVQQIVEWSKQYPIIKRVDIEKF